MSVRLNCCIRVVCEMLSTVSCSVEVMPRPIITNHYEMENLKPTNQATWFHWPAQISDSASLDF